MTEQPLDRLFARVLAARGGDPSLSYTAKLLHEGRPRIAQKLGEEAVEAVVALVSDDRAGLIGESADLLYHLLVAWVAAGIEPEDVWAELQRREARSGLAEKAARTGS